MILINQSHNLLSINCSVKNAHTHLHKAKRNFPTLKICCWTCTFVHQNQKGIHFIINRALQIESFVVWVTNDQHVCPICLQISESCPVFKPIGVINDLAKVQRNLHCPNLIKVRSLFTLSHRGSDNSRLLIVFSANNIDQSFGYFYATESRLNDFVIFKNNALGLKYAIWLVEIMMQCD